MRGRLLNAPRALRNRAAPWRTTALHQINLWYPDGVVQRASPRLGSYYQSCIAVDGSAVTYWGGRRGAPRIWVTKDGDTQVVGPPWARHPSYGDSDQQIVFAAQPAADPVKEPVQISHRMHGHGLPQTDIKLAIFVMNADGSNVRQLTDGTSIDQRPVLDPQGKRVAFHSIRPHAPGLWVMNVDGSEARPLQISGYRPWWSLDGRSLFYFTVAGRHQIHEVDVDADNPSPRPLANDDVSNSHAPALDPRGHRLIVHSAKTKRWTLHELPLDGSPMRPMPPPGFDDLTVSHGTCSRDGVVTFTSHPPKGGPGA